MSQLDFHEETIDGVTYQVRMLPARRAQRLLIRLGKIIGPGLGAVRDADAEIGAALFAQAASALFLSADEEAVDGILMELAEVTLADGKPLKPIYDVHFAGRIFSAGKWAAFALRAQFSDFSDALAGVLSAEEARAMVAGFRSQTASSGASGD